MARLSAPLAGRFLPPGRFLVLVSLRGWFDTRTIVRLEGLSKLKNSTSFITRTGDIPACSIMPQPTTLPLAPLQISPVNKCKFLYNISFVQQRSYVEELTNSLHVAECFLWSQPPVAQLIKNFPSFDWTRTFITVLKIVLHWFLSWVNSIESTSSYSICLRSILMLSSYLYLCLPNGLFHSGFPTKILYSFLFSPMHTMCLTHPILLDLIILIIFDGGYKLLSSSLCKYSPLHLLKLVINSFFLGDW
jgi:hypothetical protein